MEKSPIYPALFRLHQLQNITTNYFTSLSSSETAGIRVCTCHESDQTGQRPFWKH